MSPTKNNKLKTQKTPPSVDDDTSMIIHYYYDVGDDGWQQRRIFDLVIVTSITLWP